MLSRHPPSSLIKISGSRGCLKMAEKNNWFVVLVAESMN